MKARWKILIALTIFLGMFTGIWLLTMHVRPENEVEAYKKVLRDQGEKLELSEVLPAPVPASQNAAEAVSDAFQLFGSGNAEVPGMMQMVAPGKAMAGWAQPDARGYDFTNSWDDFAVAVAADRPALDLLSQILERPRLDFHLEYKKGFAMLLPQLADLKRSAQKLSAAAICNLHTGNTGEATTNLCVLLGLVQGEQDERLIISQLIRFAVVSIAVPATWDYLQSSNATEIQLATLQKSWERLEFAGPLENAFLMERVRLGQLIDKMRASHAEFSNVTGGYSGSSSSGSFWNWPPDFGELADGARFASGEIIWRTSWSYTDELRLLKSSQIILETLRMMETNQVLKPDYDVMMSRCSSLGNTNLGAAFFRALKIPDFSDSFGNNILVNVVRKAIKMEATRRVVVVAIALKRYQVKYGHFPEKLSELAPDLVSTLPVDPYDGLPLRYRPNADGTFLLYCVGEDGVDNGGDLTPPVGTGNPSFDWLNNHARDWVWPQLATAAEVEKYRAEQAVKGK